jgi:hypothetical protein
VSGETLTRSATTKRRSTHRQQVLAAVRQAEQRSARRSRLLRATAGVAVLAVPAVLTAMMLNSRTTTSSTTRTAPGFTLTDTAGQQVHLAALRGRIGRAGLQRGRRLRLLHPAEDRHRKGPGRVRRRPHHRPADRHEHQGPDHRRHDRYGATTPFLLDDGTVSQAYGTLGEGMQAGPPGHSFVLVGAQASSAGTASTCPGGSRRRTC